MRKLSITQCDITKHFAMHHRICVYCQSQRRGEWCNLQSSRSINVQLILEVLHFVLECGFGWKPQRFECSWFPAAMHTWPLSVIHSSSSSSQTGRACQVCLRRPALLSQAVTKLLLFRCTELVFAYRGEIGTGSTGTLIWLVFFFSFFFFFARIFLSEYRHARLQAQIFPREPALLTDRCLLFTVLLGDCVEEIKLLLLLVVVVVTLLLSFTYFILFFQ